MRRRYAYIWLNYTILIGEQKARLGFRDAESVTRERNAPFCCRKKVALQALRCGQYTATAGRDVPQVGRRARRLTKTWTW